MSTRSSVVKDDLQSLSEKMDALSQKMDSLATTVHNISAVILTTFKNGIVSDMHQQLNIISDSIKEEVRTLGKDVARTVDLDPVDWKKKLQRRKFYFYEAYRNNALADIYEDALNEETPRIPRKIFKNPVQQHNSIEDNLRKELCLKETEHEIKRLRSTAEVKISFINQIDSEVYQNISLNFTNGMAELQISKWKDAVESEERKSKEIWEAKSEFFGSNKHLLSIDSQTKRTFEQNENPRDEAVWSRNVNSAHNNRFRRNQRPRMNRNQPNFNYNSRFQNYNSGKNSTTENSEVISILIIAIIDLNDMTIETILKIGQNIMIMMNRLIIRFLF